MRHVYGLGIYFEDEGPYTWRMYADTEALCLASVDFATGIARPLGWPGPGHRL